MFDFYDINFEVKIRQNVGQILETMKNKGTSRLVTQRMFPPGSVRVL